MEYNWAELSEYREKEIKAAVALIHKVWNGKSPDYFLGVIDMLKAILLLPKQMCSPEELSIIEDMINQEFKTVELEILREAVRE
jgi:hypothetical protein